MCFKKPKKQKNKRKVYTERQYGRFTAELIPCGGCQQVFDLGSEELKIHCNLCNQFFHCNIAGKCIGKNCKMTHGHQLSWCKSCVPDTPFNRKNNGLCICYECNL